MAMADAQYLQLWKQVLTGCKLRAGEFVTILTSTASDEKTVNTAALAVRELGGVLTILDLPPVDAEKSLSPDRLAYTGRTPLTGNRVALAALKESQLIIDLMLLLFSKEQAEILGTGARMLLAIEPPEVLARLVPTEDDRRIVRAAGKRLEAARTMRVVSSAGTDFRVKLGQYPVLTEYGLADEPGRWDHWPSGFLARWPDEQSAEGKVVLDRGDIILPFKNYVSSPIELTIEGGYVRRIAGGLDADFLRDYIDSFSDPEAYAVSHLGWGLQARASWTVLGLYDRSQTIGMDARAFAGNFLFSLGPNTEAGGTRDTPCHLDIPMRHCSLSLDGEAMTVNGKVVAKDQQAMAA
jgi:2,5-dihydroxypyridine 5,6-dioxygenase